MEKLNLKNLYSTLLYYLIFNVLMWFTHLFFISIFTFFHFILDHPINVIENWIYHNGWEIITITKVCSSLIILKFVNLKNPSKEPLRDIVVNGFIYPKKEILVVIIFLITSYIFLGKPISIGDSPINLGKILLSFFCFLMFFLVDIFVLNSIDRVYPIKSKLILLKTSIVPIIFVLFTNFSFGLILGVNSSNLTILGDKIHFIFFIHFFFILIIEYLEGINWSYSFLYLLLFASPLNALFGLDPVWGENFSVYKMNKDFSFIEILILFFVGIIYLFIKKSKTRKLSYF